MQPQQNATILENPIFTMWLDDSGILCYNSKRHSSQTIEETEKLFEDISEISMGQKRCMLMDLTNFQLPSRESRELGAKEIPKMATAIAYLSSSALGAWIANLFFTIKKQPYPTKMFTDEQEAKKWLRQYL